MKALSLFNGISGLHLSLDRANIPVDTVYYSEIDKFANKVTEKQYPNDVALGDVTKWEDWDIDWSSIDLVSAGFPCQSWSVAGQGLGDKDERGMLFWTTLDIIKKVLANSPKAKFLMENVKMKKEFEEYITLHTTEALGYVEKTLINSALVSAQNRNRYYWTNFKVSQPDDLKITVSDISERMGCKDLVFRASVQKNAEYTYNGKAPSLTAAMGMGGGNVPIFGTRDLLISYKGFYVNGEDRLKFQKLTPLECERMQNIPDNFTDCISNSQRYKAIGNGWTIDVIAHILSRAFK